MAQRLDRALAPTWTQSIELGQQRVFDQRNELLDRPQHDDRRDVAMLAGAGMNDVERGINHGFFITPEDLESRPGSRVTDLLRGFPAVRVTLVKTGSVFSRTARKGWQPQGLDGCRLEIYIDGARFYSVGEERELDNAHIFIDDLITASSIAGIEVYPRSVSAPPKYQSLNGRCGVMLIWTK